jgi:hypothetical protein
MNSDDAAEGSNSQVLLPVIVGLVLGVAFIISFAFLMSTPSRTFPERPPIEDTFNNIEQIPEVKLFSEKYDDHNSTKGFGRFQNGTIKFSYVAFGNVDKDEDGIKEAFRRLELTISYDESGNKPIYKSFDPTRVKQLEIRCRELTKVSLDIDEAFADIMPRAYDGQIKDFIESSRCLS